MSASNSEVTLADLERSWDEYVEAGGLDEADAVRAADHASWLPLSQDAITERTSENRINLADNVPAVPYVREYGGYLDVVMHGDADGTQANVNGQSVDFSLDETADLIRSSPSWSDRPIRLMSCSTGQESYAQDLSDELGVPVYAPTDALEPRFDGTKVVLNGGSWRRFEPGYRD
jgi:hypothetical protein